MKRALLALIAMLACLPVWGQADSTTTGATRDQSGFLPLSDRSTPAPAPVVTNRTIAYTAPALQAAEAPATIPPATSAPAAVAPPVAPPVAIDTNFVTSSLAAQSSVYNLDDKHKLAPGDRISFEIIEDRTNAIPLLVTESSELDVPYIGRISVADKTCKQLAAEVKTLLEKDYYYKATVVIAVDALGTNAGKVYISGPVAHPGAIEIPANENFTAYKAILQAGGFLDFADRKHVQVTRKIGGTNQVTVVNMAAIMKGDTSQDFPIQDGDLIFVPERSFNF